MVREYMNMDDVVAMMKTISLRPVGKCLRLICRLVRDGDQWKFYNKLMADSPAKSRD